MNKMTAACQHLQHQNGYNLNANLSCRRIIVRLSTHYQDLGCRRIRTGCLEDARTCTPHHKLTFARLLASVVSSTCWLELELELDVGLDLELETKRNGCFGAISWLKF